MKPTRKGLPVSFVTSAASADGFPRPDVPEIALLGRSNVGKSTLLNQLTGSKKLAFVSKTPGRTQLINFFAMGNELMLVDLPGYGFAKAPRSVREKWEELIVSYLFDRDALCLALLLVDIRRDPMESDLRVRDLLVEGGVPHAVIATKADKLKFGRARQQEQKLTKTFSANGQVPLVTFSAVTNEGRKELWKVIETHARKARRAPKS